MIKKLLKSFYVLFLCISKINFLAFLRLYNSKSKNVVLISSIKGKYSNEIFMWEMSAINFFLNREEDFKISFDIKEHENSSILWSPSESIFRKKHRDYSTSIIEMAKRAESKNNILLPSSSEMSYWENKSFMYTEFQNKNILHPSTTIINSKEEIPDYLEYPLLLKGEFSSGSKDIYKVLDKSDLESCIYQNNFDQKFNNLILQQLLNIRKDLRITIVDDQIVLSYWRINPSDEWMPTASRYGSFISFDNYPDDWTGYFLDVIRKLKLPMGAFDFAWQDDNLDSTPYLLEVSPRFSPNPVFKSPVSSYGEWKKKLFSRNSYAKLQSNLVYEINNLYLSKFFRSKKV